MNITPAGRVAKTFGYKGQLIVVLEADRELIPGEPVFLNLEGKPVPFFIISAEERCFREWLIELEDIDSPEKAARLSTMELFLPATEEKSERLITDMLQSYTVIDKIKGSLGSVKEVMSLPGHDLLVVESNGRELLIPLSESIILSVDAAKKHILIDAPEGLLNLNL